VGCATSGVTKVLIGLQRVGLVGLREALQDAVARGLTDREAIVEHLIRVLSEDNYFPDPGSPALRTALWREYLRDRGEDYSAYFTEVEVVVRGEPGGERDRLVEMTREVFAGFELRPLITLAPPGAPGGTPELAVGERVIVAGAPDEETFRAAVRHSLSDW
jgi:hypothetical protein